MACIHYVGDLLLKRQVKPRLVFSADLSTLMQNCKTDITFDKIYVADSQQKQIHQSVKTLFDCNTFYMKKNWVLFFFKHHFMISQKYEDLLEVSIASKLYYHTCTAILLTAILIFSLPFR